MAFGLHDIMTSKENAPTGRATGGARKVQNKTMQSKSKRGSFHTQGAVYSFSDGNRVVARVIVGGCRALLFIGGSAGMHQVGGVLHVGGADGKA